MTATEPMPAGAVIEPHTVCGAKTRSGRPCTQRPLVGQRRCRMHGGSSPRALAKAQRTIAERQAALAAQQLGVLVETSPEQALLDEVHRSAGMVAYYGQRAREVEGVQEYPDGPAGSQIDAQARQGLVWGVTKDKSGGQDEGTTTEAAPNVWLRLWNEERDRLTRTATACLKAGIEERRVQMAESAGALVAQVIRRVLDQLDLSDQQRTLVGTVVPDALRALEIGGHR